MLKWTLFLISIVGIWIIKSSGDIINVEQRCGDGWIQRPSSNSCYFWDTNSFQTHASAATECRLKGGDLLVINDANEQSWINQQTKISSLHKTDGWHIGLKKDKPTGGWKWSSGNGVTNIKWNSDPDDITGNQDCGAINQYGRFTDNDCSVHYGYICKYTAAQGQTCPQETGNVKHWFFMQSTNICFFISDPLNYKDRYNWQDANTKCKSFNPAATLLSLKTFTERAFIQAMLPTSSRNVRVPWWTGLNDKANEGQYMWLDNTPINKTIILWDKAPSPDASEKQRCAIMYNGGDVDDAKCSTRAYYVCETGSEKTYIDVGCGSWKRAEGKCYLFNHGRGYSWSDARKKCQAAGADLVKLDDQNEHYWLIHMQLGGRGYWTGLTDAAQEGNWKWMDGGKVNLSYVNWNQEPNNFASNEDCAQVFNDGVYNDMNCEANLGYICEYPRLASETCVNGWIGNALSCYYFSNANTSEFLRWKDVLQRCNDLASNSGKAANYISIDSAAEKTFMESQLKKLPKNPRGWWTGLNDVEVEGYWIFYGQTTLPDGSLIPWSNEPNNAGGNENCAVMYEGGRFNDLSCSVKASFICEKPVPGYQASFSGSGSVSRSIFYTVIVTFTLLMF